MGSYRDDRDALRAKAHVLEGELEGTRAELDAATKQIDAKDAEIARLRKLAGEPVPARRGAILAVVTVACVAFGALAAFTMTRSAPHHPQPEQRAPVEVAVDPPAERPVKRAPKTPSRGLEHDLLLAARVLKVEGRSDVKLGATCTVQARVRDVNAEESFEEVVVKCGTVELYRLTNQAGTVSSTTRGHVESIEGVPLPTWTMRFEDVGMRSSDARPQLTIDGRARAGRVFHDGAVRSLVVLEVEPGGTLERAR